MLPDLDGIADINWSFAPSAETIAPSKGILSDLPEFDWSMSGLAVPSLLDQLPPSAPISAVSPAVLPSPLKDAQPPLQAPAAPMAPTPAAPPPPPPAPPVPVSSESVISMDSRQALLDSIRNPKIQLRKVAPRAHSRSIHEAEAVQKQAEKEVEGSDLMAMLRKKLAMRQAAISGKTRLEEDEWK